MLRNSPNPSSTPSDHQTADPQPGSREYIEYTQAMETALHELERFIRTTSDPKTIAIGMLETACRFYQADWAGIVTSDLNVNVWEPVWWYNTNPIDRTTAQINSFESSAYFERWISSIDQNKPIIILNTDESKCSHPDVYPAYQRLHVRSVLAVPFKLRPVGFLIIRNPGRYIQKSSILQLLAFVAESTIQEMNRLKHEDMMLCPKKIKNENDVYIRTFGGLHLQTSWGSVSEAQMKSPQICKMIVYMLLRDKPVYPTQEIAECLWPDECADPAAVSTRMSALIYRFRKTCNVFPTHQLIEAIRPGYGFNPNLHIMTDMQEFDRICDAAQSAKSKTRKIELCLRAMSIYKGELCPSASGELWLVNASIYYTLRYISIVDELLETLAGLHEWTEVDRYASQSLAVLPENEKTYYWLILGMHQSGTIELAKQHAKQARKILTQEEYEDLAERLKKAFIII